MGYEIVRRLAARQHGRVTVPQLKELGVSRGTIQGWVESGYLTRVLPKVYAVGHIAPSREADLWAAVLYAGPRAMLSHRTAAEWRGLIQYPPSVIEVSTPRDIRSIEGVRVHARRPLPRWIVRGIPVTSIPQTVLDLAACAQFRLVRKALSNLDFKRELDVPALEAICERGRPGSGRLRDALAKYQPQFAHTNGDLEEEFIEFCERWRIPVPQFNTPLLPGIMVDAYWPDAKFVVELDGGANHSSPAQRHRDKRNDLELRRLGLTVHRYDQSLLRTEPRSVRDEILARLG